MTDDSHAVAVIDPSTNEVTTAVSVGTSPGPLAFEPRSHSIWVGNLDDDSVTRIDSRPDPDWTHRRDRGAARGPRGGRRRGLGGRSHANEAFRDGPADRRPLRQARRPIRIDSLPGRRSEHRAREAIPLGGSLVRSAHPSWTPATGRVQEPRIDAGHSRGTVASNGRTVWVADKAAAVVYPHRHEHRASRIRSRSPAVPRTSRSGPEGRRVTLALRGLGRTHRSRHRLCQEHHPRGPAPGGGRSRGRERSGSRTAATGRCRGSTRRVVASTDTIRVGASPRICVVADGRVWVSVRPRRALDRGRNRWHAASRDADRRGLPRPGARLPPALRADPPLHLRDAPELPGRGGHRRRPTRARARRSRSRRPPTAGARYTFSDSAGLPVLPALGRAGHGAIHEVLDRAQPESQDAASHAVGLMPDLVGAGAYADGRARHIAGITARKNRLTLRLTHPSPTFPARISLTSFCAVPVGTPIDPNGLRQGALGGAVLHRLARSGRGAGAAPEPQLQRSPTAPARPDPDHPGHGSTGHARRGSNGGHADYAAFGVLPSSAPTWRSATGPEAELRSPGGSSTSCTPPGPRPARVQHEPAARSRRLDCAAR